MKKKLLIMISLIVFVLLSCKKDEDLTNPDNLSGTSWQSENMGTSTQPDYYMLKFISTNAVEMSFKSYGEQFYSLEDKGTYSISGIKISIVWEKNGTSSGVIEGKTINLIDSGNSWIFTKQ